MDTSAPAASAADIADAAAASAAAAAAAAAAAILPVYSASGTFDQSQSVYTIPISYTNVIPANVLPITCNLTWFKMDGFSHITQVIATPIGDGDVKTLISPLGYIADILSVSVYIMKPGTNFTDSFSVLPVQHISLTQPDTAAYPGGVGTDYSSGPLSFSQTATASVDGYMTFIGDLLYIYQFLEACSL